ncbi:MAG TPA: aspartate--tRNA(Asn) ligase, partial [Candidatus Obscuribacter sp.]|nr:aspartate--tRNA(Asn) ligase [Candidatus Obscuribacter sp.]
MEEQYTRTEAAALTSRKVGVGEKVMLHGHIQSIRQLGQLSFLNLRDGSGQVQLLVEGSELMEALKIKDILPETPVKVWGTVQAQPNPEVHLKALEILAVVSPAPVEVGKNAKIEKLSAGALFDYRPLTLRNEKVRAIFKIEAEILKAFREFLGKSGFTEIHSPKIVATGTEGGANLFSLDYFSRPAYLAQSPQFYKQMLVAVFERVFEVGPVYRAEEHETTRHLNEYISLDFEMGFISGIGELIALQQELLKHIFAHLKEHCAFELGLYQAVLPVIEAPIPQLELAEAVSILKEKYKWQSLSSKDLDAEGEKLICRHIFEETGMELVYITNYPHVIRPFYAMKEKGGSGSGSFDLLFRGLEITTGGQRIHQYGELKASMEERGLEPEQFNDYLMAFKHGMPPHGGLAIGL